MVEKRSEVKHDESLEFLTVQEVADQLRVVPQTVQRWIRGGKLKAVRAGRLWRIRPEDLDKFLED